jgi:hypothetical protein
MRHAKDGRARGWRGNVTNGLREAGGWASGAQRCAGDFPADV